MVHLWGRAELDSVVSRIGTLGLNGPVLTATDGNKPTGLQSLACMQRGCDPGFALRVLHRHNRLQNAYSIDLKNSVQELDQGCSTSFRPTRFDRSR